MRFDTYDPGSFYDEIFAAPGQPRQQAAERAFLNKGITFNVHGSEAGIEKFWPFDVIPRIVEAAEWERVERGLEQRIRALNLFIDDVYQQQATVRDGGIPGHVWPPPRATWRPAPGSSRPWGCGAISPASTWCVTGTGTSMCWRTTCAALRGFPTCWRTAAFSRGPSPRSLRLWGCGCWRTIQAGSSLPSRAWPPRTWPIPPWCCLPRGATTRRISSTPSWPSR